MALKQENPLTKEQIEQKVKDRFQAVQNKVDKGTLATEQHPSLNLKFHGPGED